MDKPTGNLHQCRMRRKRKLKRRTHDLRRKRAHLRQIAAIKLRHQQHQGADVSDDDADDDVNVMSK